MPTTKKRIAWVCGRSICTQIFEQLAIFLYKVFAPAFVLAFATACFLAPASTLSATTDLIPLPVTSTETTLALDIPSESLLQQLYLGAISDAKLADLSEVSNNLLSISLENQKLIWLDNQGDKQFLGVTWASGNHFDDKEGSSVTLTRDVWITAVPEVQEFCNRLKLDSPSLNLRLEQHIGLPPNGKPRKFVEMWVKPQDVFRPCSDGEIDDTRCELEFPQAVEAQHQQWINELKASSYEQNGFPWTRLGYTYDWGNPETEIGASEFVVRKGASITIKSVKQTGEYCHSET